MAGIALSLTMTSMASAHLWLRRGVATLTAAMIAGGAAVAAEAVVASPTARAAIATPSALTVGDVSLGAAGALERLGGTQWGLAALRTQEAWSYSKGAGAVVAVIDSGVDGTHPDLAGRVLPGWSSFSKTPISADVNSDVFGHGTHIAAIIAGDDDGHGVTGVAPLASILPVAVTDASLRSRGDIVADAIAWAVDHGADVINLSLAGARNGDDDSGPWCPAIRAAFEAGVIVVTSAGNSGTRGNPAMNPASCPLVVSVTGVDETLTHAPFASSDSTVTFAAPGRQIVSAFPTDELNHPYMQWTGTSMATPFVAGAIALLKSAHPDWSPTRIIEALTATAIDIGPAGRDATSGFGLVDPAAALGAPVISRDTIAQRVSAASAPSMLEVRRDHASTTVLWERPYAANATGYTIVHHGVQTRTFEPGDSLFSMTIPERIEGGAWFVVAAVDGEQRWSFPLTVLDLYLPDTLNPIGPLPRSVSASWTQEGLAVEVDVVGRKGPVTLTVLGARFEAAAILPAGATRHVIAVSEVSTSRSIPLRIIASTPNGVIEGDIEPQYLVSARVQTAGARSIAVSGSTTSACLERNLGCPGSLVTVRSSPGNIVATARVDDSYSYSVLMPWNGESDVAFTVSAGAARSPLVTRLRTAADQKSPVVHGTTRIVELEGDRP